MELGKQSQNCEIWTQNSEKKSQNCENFWIFMELGKKKSELWELNSEFRFYGGVYFIFTHIKPAHN